MAGNADATFEYSQQPFAFFANFSVSSPMRAHLQDEADFFDAARNGSLPEVSFVKPLGKYVRRFHGYCAGRATHGDLSGRRVEPMQFRMRNSMQPISSMR